MAASSASIACARTECVRIPLVGAPDASSGKPDPTELTAHPNGDVTMIARSSTVAIARAFVRHLFRVAAITGVAVTFAAPGHAQEADTAGRPEARTRPLHLHRRRRGRPRRQVPADLRQAGAHAARTRLFLRHRGPDFSGRHHRGRRRDFQSQPQRPHWCVDLPRYASRCSE